MEHTHLDLQMQEHEEWKYRQRALIDELADWLKEQTMESAEATDLLQQSREDLDKDHLTLAFVGEFSRGKTELINAIFFSEHGQRLLPSEPGRTTMCPSEIFWDHEANQPYIKLLPIETRLHYTSIAEYKKDPSHWTNLPLNLDSVEELTSALKEIVRTKAVTKDAAIELGLYNEEDAQANKQDDKNMVDIPFWRHAMVSYPHPLLKKGLRILDTPGLNAIGSEPELTISMLPNADAVLFVLGADTGVTKSDMDMWKNHVKSFHDENKKGVLIALNKIDMLWDELKDNESIEESVEKQCKSVASVLNIDRSSVIPLSAQKALLARIRSNKELLASSGIESLEDYLSKEVLGSRKQKLKGQLDQHMGALIESTAKILHNRQHKNEKQITDLNSLRGKNMEVIKHLMEKAKEEQAIYHKNVESFQTSKKILQEQAKQVLEALSMQELDALLEQGRLEMEDSWTTIGLRKAMERIFGQLSNNMEQVADQTQQTYLLIESVFRRFHDEHGLAELTPSSFSIGKYHTELARLTKEAETFRNNPLNAIHSQKYLTQKFFVSFVDQARQIFENANKDARIWIKKVLNPLLSQIKEHKHHLEARLETLKKISASRHTLEAKIKELEKSSQDILQQMQKIDTVKISYSNTSATITPLKVVNG